MPAIPAAYGWRYPQGAGLLPRPCLAPSPVHRGIRALGLICPSEGPGETWRIRETWASSRSRPRCTEVSGFGPSDGSNLLTELVSAAILSASPERVMLKSKLATSCDLVFVTGFASSRSMTPCTRHISDAALQLAVTECGRIL